MMSPRLSVVHLKQRSTKLSVKLRTLFAMSLVVSLTPTSYAQSVPLARYSVLKLEKNEQENLANYIRQCEVDKQVSRSRQESLKQCLEINEAEDHTDLARVITIAILAGVAGFAIGVNAE